MCLTFFSIEEEQEQFSMMVTSVTSYVHGSFQLNLAYLTNITERKHPTPTLNIINKCCLSTTSYRAPNMFLSAPGTNPNPNPNLLDRVLQGCQKSVDVCSFIL